MLIIIFLLGILCRFNLTENQIAFGLSYLNLEDTNFCPADNNCDKDFALSPFRTIDGSCNNIQFSIWGKARTQFQRCLKPVYSDGVWQPKKAASGNELPRY